jgi:hypothetical protein
MPITTQKTWTQPLAAVSERIENHPKTSLGLLVAAAVVVAVGIYIWPELKRTIRIHRM